MIPVETQDLVSLYKYCILVVTQNLVSLINIALW